MKSKRPCLLDQLWQCFQQRSKRLCSWWGFYHGVAWKQSWKWCTNLVKWKGGKYIDSYRDSKSVSLWTWYRHTESQGFIDTEGLNQTTSWVRCWSSSIRVILIFSLLVVTRSATSQINMHNHLARNTPSYASQQNEVTIPKSPTEISLAIAMNYYSRRQHLHCHHLLLSTGMVVSVDSSEE